VNRNNNTMCSQVKRNRSQSAEGISNAYRSLLLSLAFNISINRVHLMQHERNFALLVCGFLFCFGARLLLGYRPRFRCCTQVCLAFSLSLSGFFLQPSLLQFSLLFSTVSQF